ncbi:21027_t:CDS:2 [Gigaspora margarita]|uniref:21027_t:CDS:1 n=1 Tax=Gigaspora margarita TaxID=4874 RepID=A0ABN7UUL3_GIGMA|nr:21027_t:CDS:2 [Gigaspora margarita]
MNILKNSYPEIITKNVNIPELDPYSSCFEDYVKNLAQCFKCTIEIEPIDYTHYFGNSG